MIFYSNFNKQFDIVLLTMSEKVDHSVIIQVHKLRVFDKESFCDVKCKKYIKKTRDIAIREPSEGSIRKYSLPGNKPIQVDTLKNVKLLLLHKVHAKNQKSIRHKQRLAIKLNEEYKIISTDLRKRLHVEKPRDDVRAVTDIDDGYFKYLNGHPLSEYIPSYKSLKFLFHRQLRMRQEVGYRRDAILNIDVNHRKEIEVYERGVKNYMEQVKQFDAFISEDYLKSMACLQKWDILKAKVSAEICELKNLANQIFVTESRLIVLDYMYFMQQKYGRFLYYLSPPSWRSKNRDFAHSIEIEAKGFDLGTSSEEDTFNVLFEKMQKECCSGLIKPVLYFNSPNGLMDVFEAMEKQQLHHFTHVTHLAPHSKTLRDGIKFLKCEIDIDSALVIHMVKRFEKLLQFYDERESYLKSRFMKILYGIFFDSVGAIEVVKLKLHLEFCYEQLYLEKPTASSNISLETLAKALEKNYMEYSQEVDDLSNDKFKLALARHVQAEKIKMKKAIMAARELQLFKNLEKALLRAHQPAHVSQPVSLPFKKRPSLPTTKLQSSKTFHRESKQRDLTEAEVEYLTLFTEWTENENPANYIQSFNVSPSGKDSLK